jgi:esterase/lipase superfamily enzyme
MKKEILSFESKHLSKKMDIAVYGHFGFSLLLFPSLTDDYLEHENEGLIEAIKPLIKKGKCKVFSIGSVNSESWLSPDLPPSEKSKRHFEYNNYIVEEVVPFIYTTCGAPVPIITFGASHGAFHAANTYFRRPDIFFGVIAMSGNYNIQYLCKDYYDDNCYFNSPIHYLPNLNDEYWLSMLRSRHHVYLISGEGENENPDSTWHLKYILDLKGIPANADNWGPDFAHNYESWKQILSHYIGKKM